MNFTLPYLGSILKISVCLLKDDEVIRIAVIGGLQPEEIDHQVVTMRGYLKIIEILSSQYLVS